MFSATILHSQLKASSLGTAEMSLALHHARLLRSFRSPHLCTCCSFFPLMPLPTLVTSETPPLCPVNFFSPGTLPQSLCLHSLCSQSFLSLFHLVLLSRPLCQSNLLRIWTFLTWGSISVCHREITSTCLSNEY